MSGIDSWPPATNPVAGRASVASPGVWVGAICLLTFLAYAATLRFQFVDDDRGQILSNPAAHSWRAVPGYFASHVWAGIVPGVARNEYRPLFLLWLRCDDAIFGSHPTGWHLTTIIAHVLATYGVCLLAHRVFREWPPALCSGLIFGLHPIHIEGVAWVSGVPEPLMAGLLISSYLCWLRSREAGGRGRLWLGFSLGLYAEAMLVKEPAVVLPVILFVSEWLGLPPAEETRPGSWAQKTAQILKGLLPYAALTAVYLTVRMLALKEIWHPDAQMSWRAMLRLWPAILFLYGKLLLWPVGTSPFYKFGYLVHPTLATSVELILIVLTAALALWIWASRSRTVALAVTWLIIPLLPVLNLRALGFGNLIHNRYLYLPSIGFAMLLVAALKAIKVGRPILGGIPSLQVWIALILTLLMAFAIQVEDRCYANDATFYDYACSHMGAPDPLIRMDYANALAERGDLPGAAAIYRELIQSYPDLWNAYFNLGYMLYTSGQLAPAVEILSRDAAGDPGNAGAFFYLALAQLKLRRLDEAEGNLRRAVALAPMAPNYHFALGVVLKLRGNGSEAKAAFARELEINPENTDAARQAAEIQGQRVK